MLICIKTSADVLIHIGTVAYQLDMHVLNHKTPDSMLHVFMPKMHDMNEKKRAIFTKKKLILANFGLVLKKKVFHKIAFCLRGPS